VLPRRLFKLLAFGLRWRRLQPRCCSDSAVGQQPAAGQTFVVAVTLACGPGPPPRRPFRHGKNLNSDPWRKLQLWKATANPGHPFAR
jgi:hypothetical protein